MVSLSTQTRMFQFDTDGKGGSIRTYKALVFCPEQQPIDLKNDLYDYQNPFYENAVFSLTNKANPYDLARLRNDFFTKSNYAQVFESIENTCGPLPQKKIIKKLQKRQLKSVMKRSNQENMI